MHHGAAAKFTLISHHSTLIASRLWHVCRIPIFALFATLARVRLVIPLPRSMPDGEANATGKAEGAAGDKPAEAGTAAPTATATSPTNGRMHGTDRSTAAPTTNEEDGATSDLGLDEEDMMEIERIAAEDQKKEAEQAKGSASNTKGETKGKEENEASSKAAPEPEPAKKAASSDSDSSTAKAESIGTRSSKKDGNDSNQKRERAGSTASSAVHSNTPKEIEVLDPALNYQQVRVLKSVSEGKRVMGVSRHMLSKVCELGGGVIKGEVGTAYFYRYQGAPPTAASKGSAGSSPTTSKPVQKVAVAQKPHLSAAALKRHNESHQRQQQQQQSKQPRQKTDKQTEPPKSAAVASSQFYGGTFPYYSSLSGPPPPRAIGYLNASILRAMTAAAAAAPRAQSLVRRPSAATNSATTSARMVTYSAYPPTQFPSVEEIEASIPADASSIFHIMDRRINFDNYTRDASFYSLLRGWVQDDPYRCNPPMHGQLLAGGDWVVQVDDAHNVERPKKRRRVNDDPVDVLALLKEQLGNTEQPSLVELRSEHVARAKEIHAKVRKLDQLKMTRARESLERRYGVTL